MKNALMTICVFLSGLLTAQQTVNIDLSTSYQTMQGFGASDAWNADPVGKHWDLDVKEEIAELLFSKEIVNNEPSGIGLSRWRFNIGGGSAEQGESSNVEHEERRAECFIESVETVNGEEVVNYNWNKQLGQQWFLNAANDYGVEQLVAFVNSPPRFYTKNGRTNSDNSNRFGTTNLGDFNYNRFSDFLVTVLEHFSDEGVVFAQISPINEPQYPWSSGQEGCPWKNSEVYTLVEKLDRDIVAKGLDTKILLSEAADYRYLTGIKDDSEKSALIDKYFDPDHQYYMGDFSQVLPGIGGHSYWINGTDASISSIRQTLANKVSEYSDLEIYQTEYNLLNRHFDDKLLNAIFLAKIIYTDLEIAGVSIWDYWTAMERERWSQKNRFYLLRLIPGGGNYASLENTGSVTADKNLWSLGNFSRFIRPGYKRVATTGADNLDGLMGVSFIAPDNSELVTVYVNWDEQGIDINHQINNVPADRELANGDIFITDQSRDLSHSGQYEIGSSYTVPGQSIVTIRVPLVEGCVSDSHDAFSTIEAEDFCEMNGIQTEDAIENGQSVAFINSGDYVKYGGVDFGNKTATQFQARVACNFTGGTIEVRTGAIDGSLLGTVAITNTGGNQEWETFSGELIETTGEQNIYLVFKGGEGYLFNVNHFTFLETSTLDIKVMLESCYEGNGTMSNALSDLLPSSEPYTQLGYTFVGGGSESLEEGVLSQTGNDKVIDWVIVELRDPSDIETVIESRAGLLLADGSIVDMDGQSPLPTSTSANQVYIVIEHRNHLGIRSKNTINLIGETISVDLAILSNIYTDDQISNTPAKQMTDGIYVLYQGDVNGDGEINSSDASFVFGQAVPITNDTYHRSDVNMDSQLSSSDAVKVFENAVPVKRSHIK